MPKVAIDASSARMGGGAVYLYNQIKSLSRLSPDWHYIIYCVPQNYSALKVESDNVEYKIMEWAGKSLLNRIIYQIFFLPKELKKRMVDLLYCPGNFCLLWSPCPQILTFQNLNHFVRLSFHRRFDRMIKYLVRRLGSIISMKHADFVVFITHEYRRMVERIVNLNSIKWDVVYSGMDATLFSPVSNTILPAFPIPEKYLIAVSNFYTHKNYETLFLAFELITKRSNEDIHLVVIGSPVNRIYFEKLKHMIYNLKAQNRIHLLGSVEHKYLPALYSRALCYVSTSLLEAFPLTPFEAMACGIPVIVSKTTVFAEICGDAAIYCDPLDPEDIANKIELVLNNKSLADELILKGLEHVKNFSWDKNAKQLLKIFENVLMSSFANY